MSSGRQLSLTDQASRTFKNNEDTPLRCVTRVRGFELLSKTPANNRLPVRVDFDVRSLIGSQLISVKKEVDPVLPV
jgi:hypothetical protein